MAVKVFRIDITPEQAQALADELGRVASTGLFHPSIVEPIGAGLEGSLAYNAEEYVAAESLDVAMRHYAPAAIETVLPFITQLAGAIDFARAAGVGHGALHPRDIFMTPDEARVTGFGVVEALERIGVRPPVRRPYSPPERIAGDRWSTPADVFSLAAVTYELLTGRRPAGLGEEIGLLTPGGADAAATAVHAVLSRAMDGDPSRRYQTALAFASDLDAAVNGRATTGGAVLAAGVRPPAGQDPDDLAESSASRREGIPSIDAGAVASVPSILHVEGEETDEARADVPDDEVAGTAQSPEWEELGDIAAEREEDEADHRLRLEEVRADEREEEPSEAGADRFTADDFLLDAAGTAPVAEREYPDDFGGRSQRPVGAPASAGGDDVLSQEQTSGYAGRSHAQEMPAAPSSSGRQDWPMAADAGRSSRPTSQLPFAVMLLVGLLTGLAFGYLLWGRASSDLPATAGEYTEGAGGPSAPPASSTPAGSGATGAPRASAPSAAPAPGDPAPTSAADKSTDERTSSRSGDPPPAAPAAASAPAATSRRESAPPRQPTGTIVIRSTPSAAGVTINGQWRGRTPLAVEDLPLASHEVRVVQPGYATARQVVTLTSGDPDQTVTVQLQRQARATEGTRRAEAPDTPPRSSSAQLTGSVYVDSRPRGAKVFIDSKEVGTTPLTIPNIRIGSRVVRLELPDHRIWTSTATVSAGRVTRVTGSLSPLQ